MNKGFFHSLLVYDLDRIHRPIGGKLLEARHLQADKTRKLWYIFNEGKSEGFECDGSGGHS
ncbi:hypothetical protein DL93DRAFT_2086460 [Clavulina sp. PMI_390]|nr:hypothetical protein DL93DRAFT_2086460 [Clavulina sp. PMI_390]